MSTTDFLRTGARDGVKPHVIGGKTYWPPRKRTECLDGFSVSVQAGEYLYSTPRHDNGPWSAAEIGYPSDRPEPWDEWSKYAEDPDRPTDTVYGYVPTDLILTLIESHGGEVPS